MSRTATGILALVCVAAGAGGTFLALRHEAAPVTVAEPPVVSDIVAESEGVIVLGALWLGLFMT